MAELPPVLVAAVVIGASAVLVASLVALAVSIARRRAMARRLSAVVTRLDLAGGTGGGDEGEEEDSMSLLERLAEAAVLRVSEAEAVAARMAGALDELAHGVVLANEQGRVVYRNRAAAALAGTGPENVEIEDALTEILLAGTQGGARSCTLDLLGPPQRTLTISGRPLDDGRRTLGSVAVVEDLSERARREAMGNDFVDNVTAELRAPLGALGLLASTVVAEDDPRLVRRMAERLRDDAVRMGTIVDDLAELTRVSADVTPDRQLVSVPLVVAQAVEEARSLAELRGVAVEVAGAPRRTMVIGNRRQLVSALRRLVENALSFSPEGSAVRVEVRRHDAWVEIDVVDRGPGIPADDQERIFESFYRIARNGSRHSGGLGLGLAIASQVAGGHGGEVRVESAPNQGSTFTLRLPALSHTAARRSRVRGAQPRRLVSDAAG